ncbi:MAG: hypothetical protein GX073_02765 [Firmicutes bacterium]|nr:hypothetical protein [Bacillota bacterium]
MIVTGKGCCQIKAALKSLLALILLAGFLELLLPDDEMQKYGRMVIGLIVLFSLLNLVVQVGRDFTLELPVAAEDWGQADPAVLVAAGLQLRQRGEEQAAAMTVPAIQTRVEQFLRKITGTTGIQVEVRAVDGQIQGARVVLPAAPGVAADFLQRTVAALLTVAPEQVEVKMEFAGQQE